MSWFKRPNSNLNNDDGEPNGDSGAELGAESTSAPVSDGGPGRVKTEGLWVKCPGCRTILFKAELEKNLDVCGKCGHHFKIGARRRIELLLESGYELVDGNLVSTDPLEFTDIKSFKSRLAAAQ